MMFFSLVMALVGVVWMCVLFFLWFPDLLPMSNKFSWKKTSPDIGKQFLTFKLPNTTVASNQQCFMSSFFYLVECKA